MARKISKVKPIIAGLTGAAIGAAAGVVLASDKTREKLVHAVEGVRDQGVKTYHQIQSEVGKKGAHKSKTKKNK